MTEEYNDRSNREMIWTVQSVSEAVWNSIHLTFTALTVDISQLELNWTEEGL